MGMLLLLLVLLGICLLGFRLSKGPMQIPDLASWLATQASGQGITVQIQAADLAWAGYHLGGGVPLDLELGDIAVRNAVGLTLVTIPAARLVVFPAALFVRGAPILVTARDARFPGSVVPVSLDAALRLGVAFRLSRADMQVTLGAGRLGTGAESVPISGGGFTLQIRPSRAYLSALRLNLARVGDSAPTLTGTGAATLQGDWQGSLTLKADRVQAQDLAAYWPPDQIPQTRQWVTQNILRGTARDARFTFSLTAPENLASLALTNATGSFTGEGLTLRWIPGTVPITALDGRFTMPDKDNAVITASSARLGGLALSNGQLNITGMSQRDQTGLLTLAMEGQVADAMAIIATPPLSLLRLAPPQIAKATGALGGTISVILPFKQRLSIDDVQLHVAMMLRDVAVDSPIAGLGFSEGAGQLNATGHQIDLNASAQFAAEPATLTLAASFDGAQHGSFTLKTLAGPVLAQRLGLDTQSMLADPVRGVAPFSVQVSGPAQGDQQALLDADLTPLALAAPSFGWMKPAGTPGRLRLAATLRNNNLASLNTLDLTAPGLNIQGQMRAGQITLSAADIGRTQASGTIRPPAGGGTGWAAAFTGPVLDIRAISSPAKKTAAPPPASNAPPSGPPWQLRLNFAALDLAASPAPGLQNFAFTGNGIGSTLLAASASAQGAAAAITPLTGLRRNLQLTTLDGGSLLRAINAYGDLQGGALSLNVNYGGAAPATGVLSLSKFRILNAPAFTKVLQGLSIYGAPEAAAAPGLYFDRAVAPFTLDPQTLHLKGARAFSSSLGFTASGSIALADGNAKIDATIIPLYAVNALLGKIPVIGELFTAEKGGGLFAVRAKITGPVTDPAVSINPLSALTPGVLRDVFGLGGAAGVASK